MAKAFKFKIGEGLTEQQTKIAKQKLFEPDYAMEEAKAKSFWGITKNTILGIPKAAKDLAVKEFSIREEPVPVRRMFEAEPVQTKAPPIVTQLGTFGFALVEAIPKAAAVIYGEYFAPERKTGEVKLPFDARRLGFENSQYAPAALETEYEIGRGTPPAIAALKVFSEKTLDIAFGVQLTTQILKVVEKRLLKGTLESKIAAWETLGRPATVEEANLSKIRQTTQSFEYAKDLPLKEREILAADVSRKLNKALGVIKNKGIPTTAEKLKFKIGQAAEVGARETPITEFYDPKTNALRSAKDILAEVKSYPERFANPDLLLKQIKVEPVAPVRLLPGTRERPGQAPAFGLSTREVEPVGGSGKFPKVEQSRFSSAQELLKEVGRPRYGVQGLNINRAEARQLIEYLSSLDELGAKERGIVYKPYGTKGTNEVDIILGNTGFEAGRLEGGKVVIEARKNADGTYSISNHLRVHATPLSQDEIVEKLNVSELRQLAEPIPVSKTEQIGKDLEPLAEEASAKLPESQLTDIWEKENQIPEPPAGLKPFQESGALDAVDKLISEGKIRVVSRNNRDVFQIKKGEKWVNARDDESAVRQVTEKFAKVEAVEKAVERAKAGEDFGPRVFKEEKKINTVSKLEDKISGLDNMISVLEEQAENHPGKRLQVYMSKKEGMFEDFRNPDLAKTESEKNRIIERNRKVKKTAETAFEGTEFADEFDNPDTIRESIDSYKQIKSRLEEMQSKRRDIRKEANLLNNMQKAVEQDAKSVRKFLDKQAELTEQDIKQIVNSKKLGTKRESPLQKAIRENQQLRRDYLDKLLETTYATLPPIQREIPQSIGEILSSRPITEEESYSLLQESLPKIVIDTSTPVKRKVGILDYFRTPDRVLAKMGLGNIVKPLRHSYESYLAELPAHLELIKHWESRATEPGASKRIFRYLDGQLNKDYYAGKIIERLSISEMKIAEEIKTYLAEWARRLELPEDNQISHYITHIFDVGVAEKEFDEDLAKIIGKQVAGSVYDPFLLARLGKKGYIEDVWRSLEAYVKRGTRKANMDPILKKIKEISGRMEESQEKYIKRLVDKINLRPTEIENLVDNTVKQIIGYKLGQRPVALVSSTLRRVVYRSALGLNITSALKNLTQGVNTFAKLGTKYTLRGYFNLATKGIQELEEVGVLGQDMVQDRTLSATRKIMQKIDDTLFFLFDMAEKINRGSAYYGAKAKLMDELTRKVNGERVYKLTETEIQLRAIEEAKKLVRDTQFNYGTIDIPVGMNDAITKIFTQFLSYGTKQAEFVTEMAKNKEWGGIMRYITASFLLVYGFGQALNLKAKDFIPFYSIFSRFGETPPALSLPAEIFKAIVDTPDKYGNDRSWEEKAEDVLGKVPYPAKSQLKKSYQGVKTIKEGGSFSPSGLFQFETPETLPGQIKAILLGKYSSQAAEDYLLRSEKKEERQKPVRKIYDKIKELTKEGNREEAKALLEGLAKNPEDFATFKEIIAAEKRETTLEAEEKMFPLVLKVRKLLKEGKREEVKELLKDFTPEDVRIFKLVAEKVK